MRAHVLLRRVEYALWIAGALATGFCAGVFLEAHLYQTLQNRRLEEQLRARRPQAPVMPPHVRRPIGSLVGRLEIPRLGFKAIVLEGSDSGTLRVAVGRIPETADPGQKGNLVLAGHRDSFFRPLQGIRDGDNIEVVTPTGNYRYAVQWTQVVNPSETDVLKPTREPSLTLVTCYPFHYIGSAPQRFIVRARQVDIAPATAVTAANSEEPAPRTKGPVSPHKQVPPRGLKLARSTQSDVRQSVRWR
jgi:sortase A